MKKLPIILLLGIFLIAYACERKGTHALEHTAEDSISILTKLQSCSRLYTTEYQIRTIVTHGDTTHIKGSGLFKAINIDIPLSSRHIAIPINANIKGYIDMEEITENNIKQDGEKITVILPDPKILLTSTRIDHKQTKQFIKLFGRSFSDAEMSNYERQGRDSIISHLPESSIIYNARINATHILVPMLQKLGYKEENITIAFRKKFMDEEIRHMVTNTTTIEGKS